MILYHKMNLVFTVFFTHLLIFQKIIGPRLKKHRHGRLRTIILFEKVKIIDNNRGKLNCSYSKVKCP